MESERIERVRSGYASWSRGEDPSVEQPPPEDFEEFPERFASYPITVDASADPAGLGCALRSTEPDGVCTSIGIYFTDTPLPLFQMYSKNVTFHIGRCHARPAMEPILDLVRADSFAPEKVTAETADWDDAAEAVAGHRGKLVVSRAA